MGGRKSKGKAIILVIHAFLFQAHKSSWIWVKCYMVVPGYKIVRYRIAALFCHICEVREAYKQKNSLGEVLIDIPRITYKSKFIRMRFGNHPKGANDCWAYTGWKNRSGPASIIPEIALVPKSWLSKEDLEFINSLATGGSLSQTNAYPLSIYPIAHLLLTNVLQNEADLEMLSVVMGVEPTGSWCHFRFHLSIGARVRPTHAFTIYKIFVYLNAYRKKMIFVTWSNGHVKDAIMRKRLVFLILDFINKFHYKCNVAGTTTFIHKRLY